MLLVIPHPVDFAVPSHCLQQNQRVIRRRSFTHSAHHLTNKHHPVRGLRNPRLNMEVKTWMLWLSRKVTTPRCCRKLSPSVKCVSSDTHSFLQTPNCACVTPAGVVDGTWQPCMACQVSMLCISHPTCKWWSLGMWVLKKRFFSQFERQNRNLDSLPSFWRWQLVPKVPSQLFTSDSCTLAPLNPSANYKRTTSARVRHINSGPS